MCSKKRKMGRPPKLSAKDKKNIIMNYFFFEAKGDTSRMAVHNIYSLLSAYANKNKYKSDAYDFSRDKEVKRIIQGLALPKNQEKSGLPVYVTLDLKMLMLKAPEELMKILSERENYFKNIYMRAGIALEEHKSLTEQIISLKDTQEELLQKVKVLSNCNEEIINKNNKLEKENNHFKSYIKRTVQPLIAESIINGKTADELSNTALNQLVQKEKEPAVVSISEHIKTDSNEIVTAKNILSKFNWEEEE